MTELEQYKLRLKRLSQSEFERLYLNVPSNDGLATEVRRHGLQYHRECEAYDQENCSGGDHRGIAVATFREERRLSNKHAAQVFTRLAYELVDAGLATAENAFAVMRQAIRDTQEEFDRLWDAEHGQGQKHVMRGTGWTG